MIAKIKKEITDYFCRVFQDANYLKRLNIEQKKDLSPVSEIDLFISKIIKKETSEHKDLKSFFFLSEEEFKEQNQSAISYPSIIVDPVDGTKEMIAAIPECAVSLGIFYDSKLSNEQNEGWIYNPFTEFEINSKLKHLLFQQRFPGTLYGHVSRSEWEKGLFKDIANRNKNFSFVPRGSIAFKLGLLAAGASDFVCSLAPKNIWDIAAGTLICHRRGIYLYEKGVKILALNKMKYHPPLIWCKEEEFHSISDCLKN